MLKITVLGSGSSGNCAVVASDNVRFLIDAGLSAKQIRVRLAAVGVDAGSLDGIFLTHEHGDHTRGLDVFCRKFAVPVFCTPSTRECLGYSLREPEAKLWRLVPSGGTFALGDVEVTTFHVPHDAVDPVGIVARDVDSSIGVVSDAGDITNLMRERLRGIDSVFVEANYDDTLLENDTKRPWSTKQRIAARHGHLSNDQTAGFVAEIATERLRHVILGHLSEDCNAPDIAAATTRGALDRAGFPQAQVCCAPRGEPTESFEAAFPPVRGVATPTALPSAVSGFAVQAELF